MSKAMGRRRQSKLDLPPRMHFKNGAFYYVTSTVPRKWTRLGTDLAKARVLWATMENGTSGDPLVCEMIDQWLASPKFAERPAETRRAYENSANSLRGFFDGFRVTEIKPHHIATLIDEHPSKARANLARAVLSNVLDGAVRKGLIDRNPCREITGAIIKPRDRYMTNEEFLAIREKACAVVQACMDLSYLTACRISDVLKITLADIKDDGLYIIQGKTGKKQRYQLTPELQAAIAAAKGLPRPVRGLHLLCTQQGKPYTYSTINVWWREAYRAAGVKGVRFHDIRAKAATDAEEMGMDYQALLGHASAAMSARYVRLRRFKDVAPLPSAIKTGKNNCR